MQVMVGKSHPTIFNLIREFQKEEADTSAMFAELDAGRKIKQPQRQKYKRINERLHNLALQYRDIKDEGRVLEYLESCGYNVGL